MDSEESVVDKTPIEDVWIAPDYELSESIDSLENYIKPEPEDSPKLKLFKVGLYSPGSGEICAKCIAMSASSMLGHPYYKYPGLKDPGIEEALLFPEIHREYSLFSDDGQELYLDLCKKMNIIPVRIFYRGLLREEIDLKYYGVNPVGVRAMCMALARNRTVKRLDLTSNYLDHADACYHIGAMLGDRNALTELVLSGCKYASFNFLWCHYFLQHWVHLPRALYLLRNRALDLLDLSENNITDKGFPCLTEQILHGAAIRRLNLRRNNLSSDSLSLLAQVIEFQDHTTHLDISWNKFYETAGPIQLIRALRQSKVLVELNMSYTGLCVEVEIGALLRIKTLKLLDISHNRLTTNAAKIIAKNLILAKSLQILDLSCNPFGPPDALLVLLSMKQKEIKLKELRMDGIDVNKEFAKALKEIRNLDFRQETVITYGYILGNYTLSEQDMRLIYLKQLVRLTKTKKGQGFDVLVYMLDQYKTRDVLEIAEFIQTLKHSAGVKLEEEFIAGLSRCFPGPKTEAKIRPFSLELLADYIHRIYPEKEPSPTPIDPEPEKEEQKKGSNAKGKK